MSEPPHPQPESDQTDEAAQQEVDNPPAEETESERQENPGQEEDSGEAKGSDASEGGRPPDKFIVGIGSSAGGLDALTLLCKNLGQPIANVSLVICQHVSPDFKSRLVELLQRVTEWEVTEVEDGGEPRGGVVYVTPPNYHIEYGARALHLEEYRGDKPVPSIDRFFESLAEGKGCLALGIILSGTGSDGAEGMRAISAEGGYTLVQDPGDAKHASMPESAIVQEIYDKVLIAQEMPREIREYLDNFELVEQTDDKGEECDEPTDKQVDSQIFGLLERRTGTNFAKYKPSTIFRRIDKRLDALDLGSKGDYLDHIRRTPKELNKLFSTVLIGVTEFFRDRQAFEAFERHLRKLIRGLGEQRTLRLWSIGTASGEEAYSLAILVREILDGDYERYDVQIFATDIDERALAVARKGHYAYSLLKKVPQHLKEKYFLKHGTHYEIRKFVRSMVLFSRHDITNDPPFLRIDVILCRNLLIYFTNGLQEETLRLFHFALGEGGLLFLGKSEGTSPRDELFERIEAKERIYRRVSGVSSRQYLVGRRRASRLRGGEQTDKREPRRESKSLRQVAQDALFANLPHPFVIVNANRNILEVKGSIRLYAELKPGEGSLNLIQLINAELSLELRALLSRAERSHAYESSSITKFRLFRQVHYVRFHVYPLLYGESNPASFMVVFESVTPNQLISDKTGDRPTGNSDEVAALQHELTTTKEHLALFTEELESSNEELQTLNEELQSANEELQSANEELETSIVELQSTNEELQSSNQELRITNQELADKEEELRHTQAELANSLNLYHSLADNFPNGTINVVDANYTITFTSGTLLELFGLTPMNVQGTNVLHFFDKAEADKLEFILKQSFGGETADCTVKFRGVYLNINSIPLRSEETGEIDHVLFTGNNITELKELERSLVQANQEKHRIILREQEALEVANHQRAVLAHLFRDAPAVIAVVRGPELTYESASPREQPEGASGNQALAGKSFYEVMPELRGSEVEQLLLRAYHTGKTQKVSELEVSLLLRQDGELVSGCFNIAAIPIANGGGAVERIIFYATDVTMVVEAKNLIQKDAHRLRKIIDSLPVIAWTETQSGEVTFFNRQWYTFTGTAPETSPSRGPDVCMHPEDIPRFEAMKREALERQEPYEVEARLSCEADGAHHWHLVRVVPVEDSRNDRIYWIGSAVDTNDQKLLGLKKDEFLNVASHELKTPLTAIQGYHELIRENLSPDAAELNQFYLDKMGNSIRRINKLIAELLSVSRIESGNFNLDKKPEDLQFAVREAITDLSDGSGRIRQEGEGEVTVNIDHDRIIQALENLISNALKFSPAGEEVVVRVDVEGERALVRVTDRGPGIRAVDHEQVFRRYYRAKSTQNVEGMGLGLYITRQIVEAHGGSISLESAPGLGSSFTIALPLAVKPPAV